MRAEEALDARGTQQRRGGGGAMAMGRRWDGQQVAGYRWHRVRCVNRTRWTAAGEQHLTVVVTAVAQSKRHGRGCSHRDADVHAWAAAAASRERGAPGRTRAARGDGAGGRCFAGAEGGVEGVDSVQMGSECPRRAMGGP